MSNPRLCRCGFWGSSETGNLCSKCYKDEINRSGEKEASNSLPKSSEVQDEVDVTLPNNVPKQEDSKGPEEVNGNEILDGVKGGPIEKMKTDTAAFLPKDRPLQKNKKKCWNCQGRLELAQRELGKCRCGYIFCQLHRLPEKHNCVFNHKESGREEARQKMVPPGPRKVGRSFQRMDE